MSDLLLGVSPEFLYYQKAVKKVSSVHRPYFLAFPVFDEECRHARSQLESVWREKKDQEPYSKIQKIGELERYRSFADFSASFDVFRVYTTESYVVPEVSDYLFFNHNLSTAEHDIPYQQRVVTDLAASGGGWVFDTQGEKKKLKMLVYDIETTQFGQGKTNIPIDMIGYSSFDITIQSQKDISSESFEFDILDCPQSFEEIKISQVMARTIDEEIRQLSDFCTVLAGADSISGHNIIGFDNAQLYDRMKWILQQKSANLSKEEQKRMHNVVSDHFRVDRSFHFGVGSQVVQFYPSNFDTYLAARKFYPFLDDFSLKAIAPFLGIHLKDRLLLSPSQIKLDERTLRYNKQDVQEQLGLTLHFIQQALPLSFTTCMPFDMLLPAGAVNIWDHMAMIRAGVQKKVMPPICRVKSIAETLVRDFSKCNTKQDIIQEALTKKEQLSKQFVRVIKYGKEMPQWVLYPYVIYQRQDKNSDDQLGYHMPGGMTIKPDKDANSHFIPWYHVIVADVGAMYPTILKAKNLGADTVRLALKDETPDAWVWMKRLSRTFLKQDKYQIRKISEEDSYADKGWMIGVLLDKQPGVVNEAMTGIMNMISRVKTELKQAETQNSKEELTRLRMMYQSLKGARNAGSVDYAQRIILQDDKGNIKNIAIGKFVDDAIDTFGSHNQEINGTVFEIAEIKDQWNAYSVNKNGTVELKKIKQAVRHKWTGKLMKVTTKSGSTTVTPNHSLFTIKDHQIIDLSAEEITRDTVIVHAEKITGFELGEKLNPNEEKIINGHLGYIEQNNHSQTVQLYKKKKTSVGDCYAIPPKTIEWIEATSDYVYDISVEDNENFIGANGGIILHNTHGILSAPMVTGRQFNVWGGAAITTIGQMILSDTLRHLELQHIRVVYGDTDGIYLGCSKSMGNTKGLSQVLGVSVEKDPSKWIAKPDTALQEIEECNQRWQRDLNYPQFELEPEMHEGMIFVKHKNYLIFDSKDDSFVMTTKGNNFKGSDKPNIARKALRKIMIDVLRENPEWTVESEARDAIRESIKRKTQEVIASLDLSDVDLDDLTLIQSVQPAKRYKLNQDGSMSTFGRRAQALEKLLGYPIRSRIKLKFVVTKHALPGIAKPSKSGIKPIDFMYPLELMKDTREIDLVWYKKMIENYVQGAFGLFDVHVTEQKGLDAWM